VGRKKLGNQSEAFIPGSKLLTNVTYSHWALAYALSLRGAQKLLKAEPLAKMIPVDEYIRIMYDQHPNQVWTQAFSERNVKVRTKAVNESL
jgi:collagen beta-1,O-galactosyltransferase